MIYYSCRYKYIVHYEVHNGLCHSVLVLRRCRKFALRPYISLPKFKKARVQFSSYNTTTKSCSMEFKWVDVDGKKRVTLVPVSGAMCPVSSVISTMKYYISVSKSSWTDANYKAGIVCTVCIVCHNT